MQKNPKFEFYFSYGKNVFQWTLNKPPWCLNRNWSPFADTVAILHPLKSVFFFFFTLKEPSFLDPSHRRGGLKISETDWRNIKCVVLVDSYDPPESIGTKKVQTYLVWRHSDVISDVMSNTRKSPKIAKIMVFRYFFKQSCIFWQWCVSKYVYTCSYSK